MSADGLSELARFEVADIALAASLAERLAARWDIVVSLETLDTVSVGAELRPEPEDVAVLLRTVEAWVEEKSLLALRFELDHRNYVLAAGEAAWSVDASLATETSAERRARLTTALGTVDRAMSASRIRGLEDLRDDIVLALRLEDESP
jgi:hypothetical protein